jgi:hypothetical protein
VAHEQRTRVGDPHAGGSALQQHRSGLPLQQRDVPRDGGLGVAERVGGTGERAAASDLAENPESPYIEHDEML